MLLELAVLLYKCPVVPCPVLYFAAGVIVGIIIGRYLLAPKGEVKASGPGGTQAGR